MKKKKLIKTAILNWMRTNDYIELQAVRGQITRKSKKYQDYINQYNKLLKILRGLDDQEEEEEEEKEEE